MKPALPAIIAIVGAGLVLGSAHAHTTVEVGPYQIEAGWAIEPPVVGIRNGFVFEVSRPGQVEGVKEGVKNAFSGMEAVARFSGVTKSLDVGGDPRAGHYHSPVIPTKTGSYSVSFMGEIDGFPVDIDVGIEDVETTAVLDFPPGSGSPGGADTAALKSAMSSLQKDVSGIKSKLDGAGDPGAGPAYDIAVFGLSLGAAGAVLAVVAMIKRK